MDALRDLRIYALREALDEIVGADKLIDAGVRALVAGADSPSLSLLAGLSRREESDAHDLFRAVVSELDLAPPPALDLQARRWTLVYWLCDSIADGGLEPEVAGRLIWHEGWTELGYPPALQPLVGWVSEWEDWSPSWDVERDHFQRLIIEEATRLFSGPWPPT